MFHLENDTACAELLRRIVMAQGKLRFLMLSEIILSKAGKSEIKGRPGHSTTCQELAWVILSFLFCAVGAKCRAEYSTALSKFCLN